MTGKVFVDTNILIYAHDLDAGRRHTAARASLEALWRSGGGALSVQVLQEFYVNITRKIPQPLARHQARNLVETYAAWEIVSPEALDLLRASEIEERHMLSFWDAMILSAAIKAGAAFLWTEDLAHDQVIEGIRVVNPLLTESGEVGKA
jgi:predicted nucleic acid-binding protein